MSDLSERMAKLSPEKRALLARRLAESGRAPEASAAEPIAVVGLACRFPGGADSPESFWRLLRDGVDAIGEVPSGRWDVAALFDPDPTAAGKIATKWGGFLPQVEWFDPYFFGISPREAARMDPQQRIWLEVAWEAFEDAGLSAAALAGSRTGVFLGLHSHSSDYFWLQLEDAARMDAFTGPGNAHNIAAGRLAYLFDLRGPAITLDTACSSSLVAVHMACQSLRAGDCRTAVAGGVNAMLSPIWSIPLSRMQMLSPTGRCRAFDAAADGFVRGEGAGAIVLKRLREAEADGDRVLAVIRGSAINQDGRTNGITAPNGLSQRALLRDALRQSGVRPNQVSYVETHGTGTVLGDPIELEAIDEVLGEGRDAERPCWLGAVKSNFGHLEGAAGIAGLIKVVLSLQHGEIPPVVHFRTLNPHARIDERKFRVPTAASPWANGPEPRVAGVSSFGWSGTNVHVVVQEPAATPAAAAERAMLILPVSARSAAALAAQAARHRDQLSSTDGATDVCYTAATRRTHHEHRLAVVGASARELAEGLGAFVKGEARWNVAHGTVRPGRARTAVFVFSGQGSQWAGMGRELLDAEPAFRAALEKCDALISPLAGWSVVDLLARSDERLEDTAVAQPAIFALQVALAELWRSVGVKPAAIVGHSLGEIAAAWCSGALTLEQAALVAVHRGRLMHRLTGFGRMAAVDLSEQDLRAALSDWTALHVGALNAPRSTVLSGDTERVEAAVEVLKSRGATVRYLPVRYAFHSHHLDPLLDEFAQAIGRIASEAPQTTWMSTVTGEPMAPGAAGTSYWQRNMREPVRFVSAIQRLLGERHDVFLEIGPHPVLRQPMLETAAPEAKDVLVAHSLQRGRDSRAAVLTALGHLHGCGVEVDWRGVYPQGRVVPLPAYAWQRERYWLDHIRPYSPGRLTRAAEPATATSRASSEWLYQPAWQEQPLPRGGSDHLGSRGGWLILADRGGIGEALARDLEASGQRCQLVYAAPGGDGRTSIDPLDRAAFERLAGEMQRDAAAPWRGTVHLWPLDAPDAQGSDAGMLAAAQRASCGAVVEIVRAVAGAGGAAAPVPLWIVTRGAQPAGGARARIAIAQAPVWALARTVRIEHPALRCTCIDLEAGDAAATRAIIAELRQGDSEREVAYRGGRRLAPRLARVTAANAPARTLDARATYLITGGLGALGLETARWMVERGARHLVLVGRSAPRDAAVQAIAALEAKGASVSTRSVDTSRAADVAALIASISSPDCPLKGIVHAAGVIADGVVTQQDWTRFERVLAPKLAGAWHLHEATRDLGLDFFVLYSSLAALLGSAGQGNYAAANAFLDALAHDRHAQGLPALSVNWGAWSGGGMAATLADANQRRLSANGIEPMPAADALDGLSQALGAGHPQVGVLAVDWSRYTAHNGAARAFLSGVAAASPPAAAETPASEPSLLERLATAPAERRLRVLLDHVRGEALAVLGVPPQHPLDNQQGLRDVGLDSLMALELKNRLQAGVEQPLPSTLAFDYPTVSAITEFLAVDVLSLASADADRPAPVETEVPAAAVEDLSDEEAEALLAEELAAFKQGRHSGAPGGTRG